MKTDFLKTKSTQIVDCRGCNITLKGINLGGWLMMEAYFLHAPNEPVQIFKKNFIRHLGAKALKEFEDAYRKNFITRQDIRQIADWGFNCLRVPFHYRLIERRPYVYDQKGLSILDKLMGWAQREGLWIILDLHAAPGSQNCDWHSDSLGAARLWGNPQYQKRVARLWNFLADRYQNHSQLAGYDILNEAVVNHEGILNRLYRKIIRAIRQVDSHHIIFVEGNRWGMDLDCLDRFEDDNLALSIHTYQPLEFTFNFIPQIRYPIVGKKTRWDQAAMETYIRPYARWAQKRKRPVLVGEFGVNNRRGLYGEDLWLKDILKCFNDFGFHWTYWTYKAVKNSIFPDGIYSYFPNPAWVNRQGPLTGWQTYYRHWPKKKAAMIDSWKTKNFTLNQRILKQLRHALR